MDQTWTVVFELMYSVTPSFSGGASAQEAPWLVWDAGWSGGGPQQLQHRVQRGERSLQPRGQRRGGAGWRRRRGHTALLFLLLLPDTHQDQRTGVHLPWRKGRHGSVTVSLIWSNPLLKVVPAAHCLSPAVCLLLCVCLQLCVRLQLFVCVQLFVSSCF